MVNLLKQKAVVHKEIIAPPCFLQFRVLFANVVALFWSIFLLQRAKKLANNTMKQKEEQGKQ